jgi:hypothetical protein
METVPDNVSQKSQSSDRDQFLAFLKRASEEVATWPEWKQNTLGWWVEENAVSTSAEEDTHDNQ